MDRPTIFISSTIFDFRDLRSALKDYLELRGCRVLASEFNDFTKPLDAHSYQACLDTIEQADLFVLLIGSRVGGWLDATNKISITRAEYRRAYHLAQEGRLKLLTFVRGDVWTYRESSRELMRSLEREATLTAVQKGTIKGFGSRFMDDAEAINAFIEEVARNRETAAASMGEGVMPTGNWIHQFATFTEVRQTIDPLIVGGLSVSVAAGRKALQAQLLLLIKNTALQTSRGPFIPEAAVRDLAETLRLDVAKMSDKVRIPGDKWSRLLMLSVTAAKASVDVGPLQAALSSNLLLRYDAATGRFATTLEYDLLIRLLDRAAGLAKVDASDMTALLKHGQRIDASEVRAVPTSVLSTHVHRLFCWVEVMNCAKALARSLEGLPLVVPEPLPRSPFLDQNEQLEKEEITLEQVRVFVGLDLDRPGEG